MASDIATANPEPSLRSRLRGRFGRSRLGRLIIGLNLLGVAIIIGGAFALSGYRQFLIETGIDSLRGQGSFIAGMINNFGTDDDGLDLRRFPDGSAVAVELLESLEPNPNQRVRLFDAQGQVLWDSFVFAERIREEPLPPARPRGATPSREEDGPERSLADLVAPSLQAELKRAHAGQSAEGLRRGEMGEQVVSVSIPIHRVRAVLGVLTLERHDVEQIVMRQRLLLLPYVLVAVLVTLFSSFLIYQLVAQPVLRLASAADRVRLSRARSIALPRIAKRRDELGDLARSLQAMTEALSSRMDAIDRFAADVAHEIRNPLTSINSALETLDLVKDDASRAKLLAIVSQDVRRLDRLVTDISNASRLDAELSRDAPHPLNLGALAGDIAALYQHGRKAGEAQVRPPEPLAGPPAMVLGRDGPLGQVVRNLIDNARSFSPPDGEVRVRLSRQGGQIHLVVEDDGPGIPPENLESVFERFYTSRPKGSAFGGNSGLGLAIARQIVEAHGGAISAENRTDAGGERIGARFTVVLPEYAG